MDFVLDTSQKEIRKAVRDFARKEFEKEKVLDLIRTGSFPKETREKAGKLGFCGIHFPDKYDGGGLGLLDYALAAEEMCKKDSAMGIALLLSGFGAECLFRFGENRLTAKYLPAVATGKMRCTAAFFENMGDSDIAGVKTFAEPENGNLVINGAKRCVPNGKSADFYIVLCRTGPGPEGPEKNLTLVVVDADAQGVSVKPPAATLGGNLIDFADVKFENVKVPEHNVLGKPGRGLSHGLDFIDEARIQTAAMALGTAQGAFERASIYVKQRRQFGRKLAAFQVIRHKLAEMSAGIGAARWVVYSAASFFDKRACDRRTAAEAKLTAAGAAMSTTDEAVQLLGGYGYMTEYEVEHFYRDAKVLEIFTGTPVVLKDAIAEGVTGKIG